jgi:peptidoglycan/LPS O-acetylase OafA/YrhL
VTAYDAAEWSDFFVACAGASAALTGLLFVAVSINLERILGFEGLPERALETLMLLLGIVIVSLVGLIPGQTPAAFGIEFLAVGLAVTLAVARLLRRHRPTPEETAGRLLARVVLVASGTIPFVVGGASLWAEAGGGLYWIAAGIVFGLVGSVANAWVLLVEILR